MTVEQDTALDRAEHKELRDFVMELYKRQNDIIAEVAKLREEVRTGFATARGGMGVLLFLGGVLTFLVANITNLAQIFHASGGNR